MKFAAATALFAAGACAGAQVERRDPAAIEALLQSVFQSMTNADNHVLEYKGGDPSALRQASQELIGVIGNGIETAKNLQPLTPEDVVAISPLSQELSQIGAKFLSDIGDAAPKFEAVGLCSHIHTFVTLLGDVSNEFFNANKEKFPAESQGYAEKEIKDTNARFAEAEAALSPPCCVDQPKPAPGEGEGGKPPGEPTATTSVGWHTGHGLPFPTPPPNGDHGHGNGSYPGKPSPPPVTGSGNVVAMSSAAMGLVMGVAAFQFLL
ncbi:hypothetical protein F4678DRAFT_343495 [Xylaria arbuscula]|nr:hypothetical protein F4678DRAFT_343495 [Xylaria arbuscula]